MKIALTFMVASVLWCICGALFNLPEEQVPYALLLSVIGAFIAVLRAIWKGN
jgi:hypothetical protein